MHINIELLTKLFPNLETNLQFFVNNDFKTVNEVEGDKLLLDYLRENGYYGTKLGCGEGGCGACTVVIAEYDYKRKQILYRTGNACLIPVCVVHGKQVITIEGIGTPDRPHPVQERLAAGNSSQCGFCTPGIVMSLYGLLKLNPEPSAHDIEDAFDGNLCRCTGYRSILESARSFAKEKSTENGVCNGQHNNQTEDICSRIFKSKLVDFSKFKDYDPNMDIPFPKELIKTEEIKSALIMKGKNIIWVKPSNVDELLTAIDACPSARIIGGNSEVGVEMKLRGVKYDSFIYVGEIFELKDFNVITKEDSRSYFDIGINITLTDLIDSLKNFKTKDKIKLYENSLVNAFLSNLKWFASHQIRNFATLAGNVNTASPISDLNPILIAANAELIISSKKRGIRSVPMRNFILGYRKTDLKPDEVVLRVQIPLPQSTHEIYRAYKQSKRRDDDIALANACFRVVLDHNSSNYKIVELDLVYGGVAPVTLHLKNTSKLSIGLEWGNKEDLKRLQDSILSEVNLSYSVPGGMPTYRRTLTVSFFTRFWYQVAKDLKISVEDTYNIDEIERDISSGHQDFGTAKVDPYLGITKQHVAALKQTTGQAKYLDDVPKQLGELYGGLVMSTKAHALVLSIDPSEALSLEGVHGFVDYRDVPHCNKWGIILKDEEFFATNEVLHVGQVIGLILADSKQLARRAASFVKIEYKELPAVLTIEDAIDANSFYEGFKREITRGTCEPDTFTTENDNEIVVEGVCRIGGQEHFYLETHGCLVIPKGEDNEYEIISSTQNPTEIQMEVAHVLGIPANRVVCKVKRLGGGFGGKETRATALAVVVAVAAKKVNRPVRVILDRDIDMLMTGTRHPFWGRYRLRITRNGFFKAYDLDLISNAGHSYDLSRAVMERAMTHCDNVYKFPYLHVRGRLARTNIASNTAFRGFGGPQGMMITEMMISEVCEKLKLDPVLVRHQNMYKPMDVTHYSMPLEDWYLPEMWQTSLKDCNYDRLRHEVEEFNEKNKWKKRGLAVLPTKFGLSFTARFLNQAGALVHIYSDGSVLLSHGGIEMGQGLYTKMIQIAANTLNIPDSNIHIAETSTDKVPNTSATAASVSSDLNGMAVQDACRQLAERIKPYREKNPNGNIADWALAAYLDRVNLSANGFYKTPDLSYDWDTNSGRMFFYFTTGVAVSLVELDTLTGDHTILQSDIIMDIGQSINFSIDIGQIEGAFIQGVGWSTLEELLVLPSNGFMFTRGPGNYKIPSFKDIPQKFNVRLLKDKNYSHLKTIKSSKGVGEPPLFLGASVFFALRDAVSYARRANGCTEPLTNFQSPATCEVLRLACADELVQKSTVNPKPNEKLWSVRP